MTTIVNGHVIPSISHYMGALKTPQWKLDRGMPRLSRKARKLEAREWRGRVIQRLRALGPMGGDVCGAGLSLSTPPPPRGPICKGRHAPTPERIMCVQVYSTAQIFGQLLGKWRPVKPITLAPLKPLDVCRGQALHWKTHEETLTFHLKAYEEATAPYWKAYQEARTTHWKAYQETMTPLWRACEEVKAPHEKTYLEAVAVHLRAYEEARAPHWKAYEEAKALYWKTYT